MKFCLTQKSKTTFTILGAVHNSKETVIKTLAVVGHMNYILYEFLQSKLRDKILLYFFHCSKLQTKR